MPKSLEAKLADIHARAASKAFILADAKDADMAFGLAATGRAAGQGRRPRRSLEDYREQIRRNVRQGLIDIMLMSVSTSEALTIQDRLFDDSPVTPAVRANDTTDIHVARSGVYPRQPSRPFATALIDHAQCGHVGCQPHERSRGADLGLYSVTFNNDRDADCRTLEAYKAFRLEAESKGFRHFLEVFDPNAPARPIPPREIGGFLNDLIARTLAGVASAGRPLFLKMVYHGPRAMEDLVAYDRHLVPGVLGGASGTTYDAFKLLAEARKYGARAALFGRKINDSEHQETFIQFLRWIADEVVSPEEAVEAYHAALAAMKIPPRRPLELDRRLTALPASYGASSTAWSLPVGRKGRPLPTDKPAAAGGEAFPTKPDGSPDFEHMTSAQRIRYHRRRLDGKLP